MVYNITITISGFTLTEKKAPSELFSQIVGQHVLVHQSIVRRNFNLK